MTPARGLVVLTLLWLTVTISGQGLVLSDSEDPENANLSFTTADYFRRTSLKAKRRMELSSSADSSDVQYNLTNCTREQNPYYVPVTQEDEPLRSFVRESDEWMHLFHSMGPYKNILSVRFVKEVLRRYGCRCADRYTLKFAGFLADVFTYQLVDSITDWAYLRLEAEEEEKAEMDPKYRRQSVKKEEIDDDDDDEEMNEEEKMENELSQRMRNLPRRRELDAAGPIDLDAANRTKLGHVDPEALQEMTSFSKRLFQSRKANQKEESSSLEISKGEGSEEGEADKAQEEGMQQDQREEESSSYIDQLVEANLPDLDYTPLLDTDPDVHVDGYYPVTKYLSDSFEEPEAVSAIGTEYQAEVLGSNAPNYPLGGAGAPGAGFPSQQSASPVPGAYSGSNQPYYAQPGYQIRRPGPVPGSPYNYGNQPQYATYPPRPMPPGVVPAAYPPQAYPPRVPAMAPYLQQAYRSMNAPPPPMYSQQQYPQTFPPMAQQARYGMPPSQPSQPPMMPGQRVVPLPPGPASGPGQSPQAGRPPGVPPGYGNYGNKPP
ncbi:hypothetical protein GUITHDRAFT_133918 [Guillardia theta CCMP2712]|uniref:Uncharacterized protein n=1 Tax=Guillardia theta (strain CCMP2712) TaxID=905079 RepID=L1JUX9_GUITC|nr:hypothetical protein GUITHDRAFT_133918 [Guillardia theta CCMP2712]EKX52202.1 hypothetical protein GUITHDRAFT_133918 [Guillardia theta CCMP2712]|eukprot:XP_005839182.1 hypothetical protein GUITHDRAFT_133918 [Guillardia theta CCMP2712]